MTKLHIFLPISFFLFAIYSPAFSQSEEKSLKEEVNEISNKAGDISYKLEIDINTLFKDVQKSIDEANSISKKLKKKISDKAGKDISVKESEYLLNTIKQVHEIYKAIDKDRDLLFDLLRNYNNDLGIEIQKAKSLLGKYRIKLRENEEIYKYLITKTELTRQEKQDLDFCQTKINALKGIVGYLELVKNQVEKVKRDYDRTDEEVSYFFNAIRNGAEATQYLMEYFELNLEYEKVLQNAQNIINLEELTKGISDSLRQLSESVLELGRATENF